MRKWLVIILLVTLIPIAPAQSSGAMGEDSSGDVASNAGTPMIPGLDVIDLRSFNVREDAKDVHLDIVVEAFEQTMDPAILTARWTVDFEHNGAIFRADVTRSNIGGAGDLFAVLSQYDPGRDVYSVIDYPVTTPSYADNQLSVAIPREWLRDADGAVPAPGRVLEKFAVSSTANRIVGGDVSFQGVGIPSPHYEDNLPDDGALAGVHEVRFGVASTGHMRLSSDEPFRASNGEATTFVFHVRATNNGSEADNVHFDATGFPAKWELTLPADMTLAAGATADVPVIVRTAFAHAHGSTASFVLSMKSGRDASSVGRIEMGVFYPLIPQPAGHHDTLYIHTLDYSNDPLSVAVAAAWGAAFGATGMLQDTYMNTLEDDERAAEAPAEGRKCQFHLLDPDYPVGTSHCWDLPLDPGLVLGLDFDLARVGQISATINTLAPMPGASLEGVLIYAAPPSDTICNPFCGGREETELALINRTPLVDLLTGGPHTFDAAIVPLPAADLIPYQAGGSLTLELRVSTLRPDNLAFGPSTPPPSLLPGGQIVLPLNEYADPVAEFVDFGAMGLSLVPLGDQERLVNPGDTVVFTARLENQNNATDVSMEVIGSNREWVEIIGEHQFRIVAGENRTIAVAVKPPTGALHGMTADLVLQVSDLNDISQRSLVRFVATVDTELELDDEAALAEGLKPAADKKSPGPIPLVALSVALAALAARRR